MQWYVYTELPKLQHWHKSYRSSSAQTSLLRLKLQQQQQPKLRRKDDWETMLQSAIDGGIRDRNKLQTIDSHGTGSRTRLTGRLYPDQVIYPDQDICFCPDAWIHPEVLFWHNCLSWYQGHVILLHKTTVPLVVQQHMSSRGTAESLPNTSQMA
jgi:hypothetical protein